ncbi:MAG: hypothetical protein S4CHLAM20_03880 [Chlamydiia bacterium]|nr:hypothetical protein [Chlamydiia bacterium]
MEVKTEKTGINNSILKIYVDDNLWKTVKSIYFEKKINSLSKAPDFKKKFIALEKKKILNISLNLLSKRNYLKREWFTKMRDKLFTQSLLEEVFETSLARYFNEEEEVKRRIASYLIRGKGKIWIQQKMRNDISLTSDQFGSMLSTYCSEQEQIEKIKSLEQSRALLEKKGREKTIAFFLRRGFSFHLIQKALLISH